MTLRTQSQRSIARLLGNWQTDVVDKWNWFWFTPRSAATLAIIRIACGAMLVYMHLVWWSQLDNFFGAAAWINDSAIRTIHADDFGWSYLWYVDSLWLLHIHQLLTVIVCLLMTVGLASRFTVPLAWFLNLMYCHRLTGALFGLDQVVMMLAMYLMIAPSGAKYSLDAWLARKQGFRWPFSLPQVSVTANIATRLIQLHLCVIYLFGGLSKLRGELWWDGSALWYAAVNFEYQSLDITWIGRYPFLVAALTHVTVFWEAFYCALVWPRISRPIVLAMAVFVHGGIAIALGMITFGIMMIVANLAFIEASTIERLLHRRRKSE